MITATTQAGFGAVTGETGRRVTLEDIRSAAARLAGVAVRTPLIEAPGLSRLIGRPVVLKAEQLQPIGAFKIRGAYAAISRLDPSDRSRGIVTHSSGNHGQAVAYAARLLGTQAVIVMPTGASRVKVDGVRRQGAEVVLVPTPADRQPKVEELVASRGLIPIPPYENPDVIAGQGTVGLEILEQCPEVETILVPVGGGGLIAGITTAATALKPSVRVVGVEPRGAAKLSAALAAGRPVRLAHTASLADGLLPASIGELPFVHIQGIVREVCQVTEEDLARAVRFLYQHMALRIEPSGAATVAALLAGRLARDGTGTVAAVLSGGNVDAEVFERLVG